MYIKKKSQRQEKRTAKDFKGRTQIASGAIETLKGDVRTGEREAGKFNSNDFLIENKFTDKDEYKLTLSTWNKISKEAFRDNFRTPLMQIDIRDVQVVVFDKHLAEILDKNVKDSCHNVSTKAKSFLLKKWGLEEIFVEFNIIEVNFENQYSLYVMDKDEFLFRCIE